MKVMDVSTTNLEILYEVSKEYNKLSSLPANISKILTRVIICYKLTDVMPFELLGLRKIGKLRFVSHKNSRDDSCDSFLNSMHFETNDLDERITLMRTLSGDKFMAEHCFPDYYCIRKIGPVGMQMSSIIITLTGGDILNLYGYGFDKIFRTDDGEITDSAELIQNKLILGLINSTYNILQTELTSKDVFTNAWLQQNYYNGREERYVLSSIFDNFGSCIRFVDRTTDQLNSDLKDAKDKCNTDTNREWIIEISCYTSIAMFFYFMSCSINSNWLKITDNEDFMVILSDKCEKEYDFVIGSDDGNVASTAEKLNSQYIAWFNNAIEENKLDLFSRFLFAPANAKVKYTIQLKYDYMLESNLYNILDDLYSGKFNREERLYELVSGVCRLIMDNGIKS